MVGVIDVLTGLHGFIDPNDKMFTIYNVDKAIDFPNDGATPSGVPHSGPSLYTSGTVSAVSNITTTAGSVVAGAGVAALPSTLQVATPILTGTSGSYTLTAVSTDTQVTLSLAPSGSATYTLTGVASVPNGTEIAVVVTATTVQNTVITFASPFLPTGTLTTTAAAGPVPQYYVVNFISNGTILIEVSRSGALSTAPTTTSVAANAVVSSGIVAAAGNIVSTAGVVYGSGSYTYSSNITAAVTITFPSNVSVVNITGTITGTTALITLAASGTPAVGQVVYVRFSTIPTTAYTVNGNTTGGVAAAAAALTLGTTKPCYITLVCFASGSFTIVAFGTAI